MSLQKQLTKGISVVLVVIIIFMILTTMFYRDIEGFVSILLPRNVTISRTYERISARWTTLADEAIANFKNYNIDAAQKKNKAEGLAPLLTKLDNLIIEAPRKQALELLKELNASFSAQLETYENLLASRNLILMTTSHQRAKAAQGLQTEVFSLLEQFKEMMTDFNRTLQNPDFKKSLGSTSSLLEKISRIEKDLILAETEISLYLSLKDGSSTSLSDPKIAQNAASRVESRLRAILYLVGRSLKESEAIIHRRVLSQIETKVRSFFDSFQQLRNILEAPASELLEVEDKLERLISNLSQIKTIGVTKAIEEAEVFWGKIFLVSDEIKKYADENYRLILAFLAIVLMSGIYLNIVFPRKIGGPLKQLSLDIENFKLGTEATTRIHTGTAEIDSIGQSFNTMAQRLNLQAEVNQKYLESIHRLTQVYRELHETRKRTDSPNERIEKAINLILRQLVSQCPGIDLVKVMVIEERVQTEDDIKSKKERYFIRIGEPEYSEKFRNSIEFEPYCQSVGFNHKNPSESKEEIIPIDMGLCGWFYENNFGIKAGNEEASFFQPVYSPQSIKNNPILARRNYEKGLNGSLVTELLNVPDENFDEEPIDRGLLFVYFLDPDTKLTWQEIFFIQIIASQIASIIETDTLLQERDIKKHMDHQLNMAREIQENLLPQYVPFVERLKISKINKSAAEVGGDYYDFFELDKSRIGIVIADASGKNVPAAIIMTVFKTTLSTMDLAKMPAEEVLTRANRIIAKNITTDRFITAMYVIINAETGEVQMSSAGHNPAFVVSGRGMELALHEKNVSCPPLGIIEDFEYDSDTFKLCEGDMLFLYTDGVTEARNTMEEEFGESRLKKHLSRPRSDDPAQGLLKEIQEFALHTDQHDDITAVSIEYGPRKKT